MKHKYIRVNFTSVVTVLNLNIIECINVFETGDIYIIAFQHKKKR